MGGSDNHDGIVFFSPDHHIDRFSSMHPSLSPISLKLLPTAFRKTVSAALNGSFDDLLQLLEYGDSKPQYLYRLFLPAFYAHLDYAAAEQIERREELEDTEPVMMAYAAVQGIVNIDKFEREAELEMWPGLWKWCKLIIKYDCCMPNSEVPGHQPSEIYITVLNFIHQLHQRWDTMADNINAQSELRVFVGRVLALLSRKDHWSPGIQLVGFEAVTYFLLRGLDVSNRQHNDDLIEGCGGPLVDFARILTKFVTHVQGDTGARCLRFLNAALTVIAKTEPFRPDLGRLLVQGGFMRALVTKLCYLGSLGLPDRHYLDSAVIRLIKTFLAFPDPVCMTEALDAGLLTLVSSALENPQLISAGLLESLISAVVRFMPYCSVSIRVSSLLEDLDIDSERAERSPVWDAWTEFVGSFESLTLALSVHEDRISTRVCDNVQCATIVLKRDIKSCSGCESVNYCSVDCQRLDWRQGHRYRCNAIRLHYIQNPDPLSSRDRSFIRTIMDIGYRANLMTILLSELLLLHQYPNDQPVILIRFVDGKIGVQCLASHALEPQMRPLVEFVGHSIFESRMKQAIESDGRMHLHVFVFQPAAERLVAALTPMWMRDGALRAGLLKVAREVPAGIESVEDLWKVPEIVAKVQELRKATCLPVPTH